MNTLHLLYAVEVERCGSITQAAENLYMAQPNLSKAVRELEESMGFAIFSRTSRGVFPTEQGKEFLACARAILTQVKKMEAISGREALQRFSLIAPCGGSVSACVSRLLETVDKNSPAEIRVQEAGSRQAVQAVAEGQFDLGILRVTSDRLQAAMEIVKAKRLVSRTLWEGDALVTLSVRHPLAGNSRITPAELSAYPLLTDGGAESPRPGRISAGGYFGQMEMLSRIETAYMWSPSESARTLAHWELAQRPCPDAGVRFAEIAVWRTDHAFSALEQLFLKLSEELRMD